MNGASLCNSMLLHSHSCFQSSCFFTSSSPSSAYLISPCFTTSSYISVSHRFRQRFRAVVEKRSIGFRSFAVKKRRNGDLELIESEGSIDDEDEEGDWSDFDVEAEGDEDEDEGELLPMDKMKKWMEKKPNGFGLGKKYETSIEDKLLDEIEQSWKAQAANLNKLKNNPLKSQLKRDDNSSKGPGETLLGFRVRVTNLPKKKNVHRDLKTAFKEESGILNITPAVSGNKKTKDPVCKGFALVDFKTEIDANRFVEQFNGEKLSFGKVIKQIKCQVVDFSSNQSESEEEHSDKSCFEKQELLFSGSDVFLDSWEESNDSDKEVDESEVEENEQNLISSNIEPRQVAKQEIRELETPLVSLQVNQSEEAVAETHLDDELDRDDAEEVESLKSSMSSSEKRIERIRKLELKLLGRERGADSDKPEAKAGSKVEGKKKKTKIVVKGKKGSKIEIPGSSQRLKVKEKALLSGVLSKYAAKAASISNDQ